MRPSLAVLVPLLALLLGLPGACALPEGRGARHAGDAALAAELRELERRGSAAAVVAFVERSRERLVTPEERARFELARARALARQRQLASADLAFLAAWKHVEPRLDELAAEIHEAWGDARLRAGAPADAVDHYRTALRCRGLDADHEERLMANLAVAHDAAGDRASALLWERRLGAARSDALAAARERLAAPDGPRVARGPRRPSRPPPTWSSDPARVLPELHRRTEWGARAPSQDVLPMAPVYRLTVHHSAEPAPGPGGAPAALRHIQDFHKDHRGWADIGYHVLIDPQGGLWEGRDWGLQGAHASGANNVGNLGICVLGDFSYRPLPPAQLAALLATLDRLRTHYGLDADRILTHRELKATECPGRYLQSVVSAYRARLRETVARQ